MIATAVISEPCALSKSDYANLHSISELFNRREPSGVLGDWHDAFVSLSGVLLPQLTFCPVAGSDSKGPFWNLATRRFS